MRRVKHEQQRQRTDIEQIKNEQIQENTLDSERRNILENTLALEVQKLKEVIVRISGVENTIEKLKHTGIAVLTGKAGTGKTTTAYQVMREMSDPLEELPSTPVFIKSPEQWDKIINRNHQYIVFLDDVFGSTDLDAGAFEKWKNQLEIIYSCSKTGNVMVLIGIRKNVFDKIMKYHAHAVFDDENIIDLSLEENLSMEDKSNIFESYENNCELGDSYVGDEHFSFNEKEKGLKAAFKLLDLEKLDILTADLYFGFPLTCFRFFTKPEFYQLGLSYFRQPDENLLETIENMRRVQSGNRFEKIKYCVLCYVLINKFIDTKCVSSALIKTICEKVGLTEILEIEIKDAVNDLNGLLLTKKSTKQFYTFSQKTVFGAILVSFGQLAPEIVIKYCSRRNLYELIRTDNYEAKFGEVVLKIPRRYFRDLFERLLRDVDGDDDDGDDNDDDDDRIGIFKISSVSRDILLHPVFFDPEFASFVLDLEMFDQISTSHYAAFDLDRLISIEQTVLLAELLERCGPHHIRQNQHTCIQEPKFEITIDDISDKLSNLFSHKCVFEVVLQYILKYSHLPNVRGINDVRSRKGLTALHYRILCNGFDEFVDVILDIHKPTKTINDWSCVHLAAYAGKLLFLKKFMNLGQNFTERTSEGYSVLQAAVLGIAYRNKKVPDPLFQTDIKESDQYKDILKVLLTNNDQSIAMDLSISVDEYRNNITHYLVIQNDCDILDCLLHFDKMFVFERNISPLPTSLHVAVYLGRPAMMRKLWSVGVRPREGDLSLMRTNKEGEHLNSTKAYIRKNEKRASTGKLWIGRPKKEYMILRAIYGTCVDFGGKGEFQEVRRFLMDEKCCYSDIDIDDYILDEAEKVRLNTCPYDCCCII